MKRIYRFLFCLSGLLFFWPIVFAGAVFSITTTDQSSSATPGETITITYTVTNTSGANMPNMRYFPPAGTTRTGGTCSTSLANNASCTVILSFTAPSTPGTYALGPMKVCGYGGQICSQSNAANQVKVTVAPAPASGTFMIGSGLNVTTSGPLVAQSLDSGSTFSVADITGATTGQFFGAGCTGSGSTAICVAVGFMGLAPLIASTTDRGISWSIKSITGDPPVLPLNSVACTGTGSTAFCTAASQSIPTLVQSLDGSNTWGVVAVSGSPLSGNYTDVSCTAGNTCAAVGIDFDTFAPFISQSFDTGANWAVATVTGLTSGVLNSISCVGNPSLCVAGGQDGNTNLGVIAFSNGGGAWTQGTFSGAPLPALSNFSGVGCSPAGGVGTAVCVASGLVFPDPTGIVATSNDGGQNWTLTDSIGSGGNPVSLGKPACVGTGASARCVVVGGDTNSSTAILKYSTDGGQTWIENPYTGTPGTLSRVSCAGSGATAQCIATGTSGVVIVSLDGGVTWSTKTVSGLTSGQFSGGTGITE